jgi:hypothetical protein
MKEHSMKKNRFIPCLGLFAASALVLIFAACDNPDSPTLTDLTGTVEVRTQTGSPLTNGVLPGDTVRAYVTDSNATEFKYQWQKATSANGTFTNIAGKTSPLYIIAESDVAAGQFIRVAVTASGYNDAITSTAVEIEAPGEAITGTVTFEKVSEGDEGLFIGDTVKATVTGSNVTEFEYLWQRRAGATGYFVNITGRRTADTYTLSANDVAPGDYIRVVVTAAGYSRSIESEAALIQAFTFTITFDPNGGTLDTDTPETLEVTRGEYVSLNDYFAEKSGKAFAGWYKEGDPSEAVISLLDVSGDTTLVAKWATPVTVTLNLDGGSLLDQYGDALQTRYIIPLGNIWFLYDLPAKSGLIFICWYKEGDSDKEPVDLESGITVDEDITLVAKWAQAVTVTLNLNGGAFGDGQSTTFEVADGESFNPSWAGPPPNKDGFVLAGWLLDGDPVYGEVTVEGNMTLTADWLDEGFLGVYANPGGEGVYVLSSYWSRLTGAFFSSTDIHISRCSSVTIDGKAVTFDTNEIKVDGVPFIKVTETKRPAPNNRVQGDWTNGTVRLFLSWGFGEAILTEGTGEDANTFHMSYAVEGNTLFLLRGINWNRDPGELIWPIQIVDDALQDWTKVN